jgi:RNA polymerase sigma factor (sigma-70 family)
MLRLRSDDQLVALFRMGYDEAFRVVHDRYRSRLLAYTRQMLGASRSDAEDVLQDVFLRAYGALRQDDRPVTLRAWLYRVAHNRCIDHLRRPVPVAAEVYELSRTPGHDPSAATERREDLRRLVQDVQRLPEQQRSALLMREMEGLTYAELADALRTSVPAVKSLLVRARTGLTQAGEARDAACADIRMELAVAERRGVRASGRSRRHLRDCAGCRDYRRSVQALDRGLAALTPTSSGLLGTFAKLLGLGGASSGAAAGAGAGGSAAVIGGAGAATATKVAAIVCCAAVVGSGAVEVRDQVAPAKPKHQAARLAPSATPATADPARSAVASLHAPVVRARDPLGGHESLPAGAKTREPRLRTLPTVSDADGGTSGEVAAPAASEEVQTGGAMAPDEAPAVDPTAPVGNEASAPGAGSAPATTDPATSTDAVTVPPPAPVPTDPGAVGGTEPGSVPPG